MSLSNVKISPEFSKDDGSWMLLQMVNNASRSTENVHLCIYCTFWQMMMPYQHVYRRLRHRWWQILLLNENETEVIVFDPKKQNDLQCLNAPSSLGFIKTSVKMIVVLDGDLKMNSYYRYILLFSFRLRHFYPQLTLRKWFQLLSLLEWISAIPSIMGLIPEHICKCWKFQM